MIYGDQKKLEMARSILPSRARKRARAMKAHWNRSTRRNVRMDVRRALFDEDYELDDDVDPETDSARKIRITVRDRRDADKLNHFMKWAEEITADKPLEDRLPYMKGILPKNLIGQHAVGHLQFREHFDTNPARFSRWRWRYTSENKPLTDEDRIAALKKVVETHGLHRKLNNHMKRRNKPVVHELEWVISAWADGTPFVRCTKTKTFERDIRFFKGPGDYENFLKDLRKAAKGGHLIKLETPLVKPVAWKIGDKEYRHFVLVHYLQSPDHHPEWFKAFDEFVRKMNDPKFLNDLNRY